MKSIINKIFSCLLSLATVPPIMLTAQNVYVNNLEVTDNKTTSIVFPHPIESIDLGSRDVLAQKVPGTENVLQIKADTSGFRETNVTVITKGGSLHQFNVRYNANPNSCYFLVSKLGILDNIQSVIFNETNPISQFEKAYKAIQSREGKVDKAKNGKVRAVLHGIYVKGNNLFFNVSIQNNSNITYDIESILFLIKDTKQAKRTAIQENQIIPVHCNTNVTTVGSGRSINLIYTFEKFTLPSTKELLIDCTERNGGRQLTLKLNNNEINNSRKVNVN
jgi:conjugative transposon TraN protein